MTARVTIHPDVTGGITATTRSALTPGWLLDVVAFGCLLVPGVIGFGPVFGGSRGYVAAGVGAALGLVIGFLGHRLRWGVLTTTAVALVAYLLGGGAVTLRDTTLGGFIPSVTTLSRLAQLIVQSWRDLLTSGIPAEGFSGPAVVPFASALAAGACGIRLALSRHARHWAIAPALALLVVAILWGIKSAPYAAWQGGAFAAIALGWVALRPDRDVRRAAVAGGRPDPRRAVLGSAMIAVAVGAGLVAGPALAAHSNRHILRDEITPPLDPRAYPSPLTQFRHLSADLEKETLLTVSGLPPGQRIRLAVLDAFDGHVYNVSGASADFRSVGERVELAPPTGTPTRLHVLVGDYQGPWLPGGGDVRRVSFTGPAARAQARSLYVNPATGTALTAAGVGTGTAYDIDVVLPRQATPEALRGSSARSVPLPDNANVPEIVGKIASDYVKGLTTAYDQAAALATNLALGAYANTTVGPGHSTERIARFLKAAQLTGDDEQYAATMALMARQLGLPARVVMGFYPPAGTTADPIALTGRDAHVWVEVAFTPDVWQAFDPTPDRDRLPKAPKPEPKKVSSPQVLPPPLPPVDDVNRPNDLDATRRPPQSDPRPPAWRHVVAVAAYAVGGVAALSSPFVLIVAAKGRRRGHRRRAARTADRFSGGWAEVLDRATDLGRPVPERLTHREGATFLGEAFAPASAVAVAEHAGSRLFAPDEPSAADAENLWQEVDSLLGAMSQSAGRRRALRAMFSLRSFRGRGSGPVSPPPKARPSRPRKLGGGGPRLAPRARGIRPTSTRSRKEFP